MRIASRLAAKTYRDSETLYGFDNFLTVDFFTKSVNRIPKPYFYGELFSNIDAEKIQSYRIYGGLHLLKFQALGVDIFYAYWKTRPAWVWKDYNIFGLNTKFCI